MEKFSLDALGREHLERARGASSGRSAATVYGGHEHMLRQTIIAMMPETILAEHENPGESTLHILVGRIRLVAGETSWEARSGDLLVIPSARHEVQAVEESVLLLTVALLA
ncbi:MAG TPA: LuxR family transcriptional regulator [Candidatus Nanopelagicaceae bacterium]|nr:LuxR family transcriptional regulator [Candidatus Nanopelagicaceae bacterium]